MNEIVNTTNREKIEEKFVKAGDNCHNYRNKLYKTCFQHDVNYCSYKNLTRTIIIKYWNSNKILHEKAFEIAGNPNFYGCQRRPVSMVYKLFDKKSAHRTIISKQQLANELKKPAIRKIAKTQCLSFVWRNYMCCRSRWNTINKKIWSKIYIIVMYYWYL